YASQMVLQAVPGMTAQLIESILELRTHSIFQNREDLQNRTGLAVDAAVLNHLAFDRGRAPAVLAIAHIQNSSKRSVERRTQTLMRFGGSTGGFRKLLWRVERHSAEQ